MEHATQEVLIKDGLVFLFAAGLIVPLLRSFKLPSIVGFILAGVALGPNGVGAFADSWPVIQYFTLSDPESVAPFAELGVLFLLFLLGLELSFSKLWALRRIVFGAGLSQAIVSAAVIGLVAYALGLPAPTATLIGLALALSSTAIVMQLLIDNRQAAAPIGRTSLGILLLQDILVAPILIFAGFAAADTNQGLASILFEALVEGFVAIAIIVIIGRFLLSRLFHLAAADGSRDFLMALTLLTVLGAAVITASAGLSIALGAFLAGMLLGETEFKHQTEVDLEPFKGLLLGLFFMTVGLGLDLGVIFNQWPVVLGGMLALIAAKLLIAGAAVRLFAGGNSLSVEAAFLLAPAGEFAFVIVAAGAASGMIDTETATLVAAIAGLSMLLTPASWRFGRWLGTLLPAEDKSQMLGNDFSEVEGQVIIAGLGRVGQAVARILDNEQAEIVAFDTKPETVARERKSGRKIYLGDGSREEVLLKAGLHGASMVVVTLDDPTSAERTVQAARRIRPEMPILARAKDADHARLLYDAGASFVVPDAIEAGLQMSARALEEYGYEGDTVRDMIALERDTEYRKIDN